MILVYPEFQAEKVFMWARGHEDRVTVLFPAPPLLTKCIGRVLREVQQGKTILAWGDRYCIENLKHRLESSGIETYEFLPDEVK